MIRRRQIRIFALFFFGFSLALMIFQYNMLTKEPEESIVAMHRLEDKIKMFENEIKNHMEKIKLLKMRISKKAIEETPQDFWPSILNPMQEAKINNNFPFVMPKIGQINRKNLTKDRFRLHYEACPADVNVGAVYDELRFANPNGGVWTQGFPIETSDVEWVGKKLKVFIVPHSHNDPGWLQTMQSYFTEKTKHILDSITAALIKHPKRRFIWAETSFLFLWWKASSHEKQQQLKTLVQNGQLEIVTGGWVMNDEANTHYFAMIDQMIEGHSWLSQHLNITPRNGWAIDPFGYSPTMAYLLQKMKFESMVVQRVHYAVKKYFAIEKLLEFRWRQSWSANNQSDIACHVMPFYFYDIPHTCGPDPKICCQFDFVRIKGGKYACPWNIPATAVTDENVDSLAKLLLDQYRKKSKLFKSDTLLVPLGDDFRYTDGSEVATQFTNYEKLIGYINGHPELNAELKFATLDDYFDTLRKDIGGYEKLPSLTGDFFTYSDVDQSYWSGYYTTRPFYKRQERILESKLRAAEIFYSFARSVAKSAGSQHYFRSKNEPLLTTAHQNLALFQHHDGITGTSRGKVVVDYGKKLVLSIIDAQNVLRASAELLLSNNRREFDFKQVYFDYDEIYKRYNELPHNRVIEITNSSVVDLVICNSLSYKRTGLVSIFVSDPHVLIIDSEKRMVEIQVNLVWSQLAEYMHNKFEVQFIAAVPALGLETYQIRSESEPKKSFYSKVSLHHQPARSFANLNNLFDVTFCDVTVKSDLVLTHKNLKLKFSSWNGLLESVEDNNTNKSHQVFIQFMKYSQSFRSHSGAYTFSPGKRASFLFSYKTKYPLRVVRGPLSSEVHAFLPKVFHRVVLHHHEADLFANVIHIHNLIDLRGKDENMEIAMRIQSGIKSNPYFYTDLNGFQMIRRKIYAKLPLQANFYPMPTMAFIQDNHTRLSILTQQPLGAASLESGQMDVMLDRRLTDDDNRGLMQGVTDNVPTLECFTLLLENWELNDRKKWNSSLAYPSMLGHRFSWELLHPLVAMSSNLTNSNKSTKVNFKSSYSPVSKPFDLQWPCDLHLVNLRSLSVPLNESKNSSALILHRVGYESGLASHRMFDDMCYANGYELPLTSLPVTNVMVTSLSLQHDGEMLSRNFKVDSMEIEAFKVVL